MTTDKTDDARGASRLHADLGLPPMLKPCPFCGEPLAVKWRRVNPSARCITEDCWGSKMPALQLDIPEHVAAWNTRLNYVTNQQ